MEPETSSEWTVRMRASLAELVRHEPWTTDAELVDRLRVLEEAKAVVAAEQVRLTVELKASQERAQREAGVSERRIGLGIGSQVALAKRESPARGRAFLHLSEVLAAVAKSGQVVVLGSETAIKAANDEKGGFLAVTKVL